MGGGKGTPGIDGVFLLARPESESEDSTMLSTELQRAEEALLEARKESESRYRAFFDLSPDLMAVSDLETGCLLDVNRAFERWSGYSRSEVIGKATVDLALWPDPKTRREVMDRIVGGSAGFATDVKLATRNGAIRDVNLAGHVGEMGGKKVLFTVAHDVTERRLVEEALRESEERFRKFADEATSEGIIVHHRGRILDVNLRFAEMFGYERSELIGMDPLAPIAPECREMVRSYLQVAYERSYEACGIRKDGTVFPMEVHAKSMPLHGQMVRVAAVRDLSERKRAEEALGRSEQKYRSMFENSISGIFQTTPEGQFVNANPALAAILGYESPAELMSLTDVTHQIHFDPQRRMEMVKLVEERNEVREFEVRVRRKDGAIAWVTANVRAVRDSSGRLVLLEGSIQDITDRKMLESRLLQAEKMEAIGTLAGGIAHDFNNILAAIMGFTELTKNKVRDGEPQRYLEQVLTACQRAKNLVTQILTFSRKAENEMRPLDMGAIVREALRLLRATLPATIEIRSVIGDNVSRVLADSTQMHQVLLNLGTNAAHAMRERGGVLDVGLENIETTPLLTLSHPDLHLGQYVKLTVKDTGVGMPAHIVDRIFDPFFTTKGIGEGTGLGLSVVYGIVKERGGTIAVESEPGEGSMFCIYLPAVSGGVESRVEELGSAPGGAERILFVDDEILLVEMGREVLRELGYKVVATTSSARALKLFRAQPLRFNLLITDMAMPEMTGLDLTAEVLSIRPDLPVILCTGYSDPETEQRAKALGIRDLMMKPISLLDMSQSVRKVLDRG